MEQTLGKRISANRKRLGLTQDQLAEQLGVTAQAVSKWENDQSCPDITTLPRLATIFGITTDALLGQETIHQAEVVGENLTEEQECSGIHLQRGDWVFRWDAGRKSTAGLGLWVMSTGILYLLKQCNSWDVSLWGIAWPTALIWYGLFGLFPRFSFFRLGCTVFGGFFLMEHLLPNFQPFSRDVLLTLCLILWGLSLVVEAFRKKRISGPRLYHNGKRVGGKTGHFSSDFDCSGEEFHCDSSFGSEDQLIELPRLSQGSVDVSFGSANLNLSGVEEVSENCRIQADASFGEITLLIPSRFLVDLHSDSSFGDVSLEGQADPEPLGTIRIDADVSFGHILIRYL